MGNKLCIRLGAISGAWVGMMVAFLHVAPCCASPPGPAISIPTLMAAGLIVAFIVILVCVLFLQLVRPVPWAPLIAVSFVIWFFVGVLLGPIAYWLSNAAVALVVCAVLGALLAWLICWLLCRQRDYFAGVRP